MATKSALPTTLSGKTLHHQESRSSDGCSPKIEYNAKLCCVTRTSFKRPRVTCAVMVRKQLITSSPSAPLPTLSGGGLGGIQMESRPLLNCGSPLPPTTSRIRRKTHCSYSSVGSCGSIGTMWFSGASPPISLGC